MQNDDYHEPWLLSKYIFQRRNNNYLTWRLVLGFVEADFQLIAQKIQDSFHNVSIAEICKSYMRLISSEMLIFFLENSSMLTQQMMFFNFHSLLRIVVKFIKS